MANSRKRQLAKKKADAQEKKFFKYAILGTIVLLVILFIYYSSNL